jgi:hypothetical protein
VEDALYHQEPTGQVYEPLNEDACAGLAAGLALFGARSVWLSYESFAINGWPIVQTVTQAMAELRRKTPSFDLHVHRRRPGAGPQRLDPPAPGDRELLRRPDAQRQRLSRCSPATRTRSRRPTNGRWARHNKGIAIIASKSPLPVYTTLDQAREGIEKGAVTLYESAGGDRTVVFAVTGDMALLPVFEAKDRLEAAGPQGAHRQRRQPAPPVPAHRRGLGHGFRTGQRLHGRRPFNALFDGDVLIGVTGGPGRPAGTDHAAHPRRAPRRAGLEARRNHRQPGRDHGLQRHHRTAMAERAEALLAESKGSPLGAGGICRTPLWNVA